jgi:hypothetical protein
VEGGEVVDPKCLDITSHYTPFGSGLSRPTGTHLTSIIRSLQTKLGIAKTAPGWEMNVCADIGFLWEDALSRAYRDKRVIGWVPGDGVVGDIYRPWPMEVDGVWMSPDGIGPDPLGKVAYADHEYKCTWRSVLREPLGDFYWKCQFQSYARGMETTITILHVMYLMGDYRGSGPMHRVYRMRWTTEEMEKTWGMILRHKKEMAHGKGS